MDPKLSIKGSGYTRFQNRFTLMDSSSHVPGGKTLL